MAFKDNILGEPARYRVTFYCFARNRQDEEYFPYTVCTRMGERKAIAWAAFIHSLKHSKRTIYDINVEPLGEAASEGNDLVDRMEW